MEKSKINIANICLSIEKTGEKVSSALDKRLSKSYDDNEILQILTGFYEKDMFNNATITNKALELMQLLNDDYNVKEVNLENIGMLYKKLMSLAEFDISIYESVYHYYNAVLDKPKEIIDYILNGINKIKEKINELEEIIRINE